MGRPPRLIAAICTAVLVVASSAQDAVPDQKRRLADGKKEFELKRADAKREALRDFDKMISTVRRSKAFTEAARRDKVKEVERVKKEFEKEGTFPNEDEYAGIELRYYTNLNKGYLPLAKLVNEVMDRANKTKNESFVKQGLKMKEDLEKLLPGAERFTADSQWNGRFFYAGEASQYRLRLTKKTEGGRFTGHVTHTPGVEYEIEGQSSGLVIEFAVSKLLRGSSRLRAVGVVTGDKVIARDLSTDSLIILNNASKP